MESSVNLIVFGLWLIAVGFILLFATRRFIRVYQKKWFDQSKLGPCDDMEWCQIKQAIRDDPIHWKGDKSCKTSCEWNRRFRYPCNYIFFDFIIVVGLSLIIFESLCLIFSESSGNPSNGETGIFSDENVAFGTVLTLLIGAVAIYYQTILKAKTENRQKWTRQIREDISILISNAPTRTKLSEQDKREKQDNHTLEDKQFHFERLSLALNPSERIHRGMLAAIRFLYDPEQFSGKKCNGCELCDE